METKRIRMIQMRLIIISIVVMLSPIGTSMIFADYDSKTEQTIYKIETAEDLYNIRTSPSAIYLLMNDIDVSEYSTWKPIEKFDGILDGKGYTIEGLKIDGSLKRSGLFETNRGIIKDIVIQGPEVSTGKPTFLGIIAAENLGKITNVYINEANMGWSIFDESVVGVVVGKNSGKIQYSYTSGRIRGEVVGGLVGRNERLGDIRYSSFSGKIESRYRMGGLVGNNVGKIENCFSQVFFRVIGNGFETYVGGIAGQNTGGVNYCYVDARGEDGKAWENSTISGVAPISGRNPVTGLSFYNKDNIEPTFALERVEEEGRSTGDMKLKATYIEARWDFDGIWGIEDGKGYPYLQGDGNIPVEPENPEIPLEPIEPGIPVEPEKPEIPLEPIEPEIPVEPENPEIPLEPIEPGIPVEPEDPGIPLEPIEPGIPVEPEDPEIPLEPIVPGIPVEPEKPEIPLEPIVPEEPVHPGEPAELDATTDSEQALIITPMQLRLIQIAGYNKEFVLRLGRRLIRLSGRHYGFIGTLSARYPTIGLKMESGVILKLYL